uniref:Leucine rich immune protein (Short) n=1 Tax=Anopheles culicifacies TaxID=139723 RepID=A0A182MIQ9_9DIPT
MGCLYVLSLLSVFFGWSMVAVTGSSTPRYMCRETHLFHDCVFVHVFIEKNTSNVYFGHDDIALNDQRKIAFKTSTIRRLRSTLLDSFRQIRVLDLSNLVMEEIDPHAFRNGTNIRELNLSFNFIEKLSESLFRNMRFLSVLVLDRNNLSTLPEDLLYDTPYLFDLSIANNNLEQIKNKTFKRSNLLQYLTLSSNKLKHIDLTHLPRLYCANVSSNLLRTLTIPEAVSILDASHNRIDTVQGEKNKKLEILRLHHNHLTNIDWLQRYPGLVEVDLAYNKMERLYGQYFTGLDRIERLNLSHNRLIKLNIHSAPIQSLKVLDIRHNDLTHVEWNKKQFDALQQLYLDHNSIVTLKLSSNNTLRNLTLSNNDWDCASLVKLFQNVNRSVVGDSDRSCKQDYQLEHDLCCKVSAKPYLDRLIQYNIATSVGNKHQRANRCRENDEIASFYDINQLQSDTARLVQYKSLFKEQLYNLNTEINNYLERHQLKNLDMVHTNEKLRHLLLYLKNKQQLEQDHLRFFQLQVPRSMQKAGSLTQENAALQDHLNAIESTLKQVKEDTMRTSVKLMIMEGRKSR